MVDTEQQVSNWQPTATMATLLKRAEIIQQIRQFFIDRGVTEVETPAMSHYTVTDVHLQPLQTEFVGPGAANGQTLYLMTSPEYHMKRLLAAGSGPIFQLAKAFRNEEAGRYHNPEFTLLEWYHPYYDMFQLMNEVDDLLSAVLACEAAELCSYQQLFVQHLQVDPLLADKNELQTLAKQHIDGEFVEQLTDRDALLQLLFSLVIEPQIGKEKPIIVYHFPAGQAALAQISAEDQRVAERFEVYYHGIELANGFHELTDAQEQQRRFTADNRYRAANQLPERALDQYLLAALTHGLPDCSGVALGIDRLIMLALNAQSISDVLTFPVTRA